MFFFHTFPAISGDISALTGGPGTSTLIAYSATRSISSFVLAFSTRGAACGILLTGDPGSLASCTTPAYSEWSVTPAQSSGVSILMSYPSGCLIGWPLKYLYASAGVVWMLPIANASTDQPVCTCVSPKYALRSGLG